ncbi:MAG: hypothetical protein VB934_06825, partial [Polyangiaceae bacterium]
MNVVSWSALAGVVGMLSVAACGTSVNNAEFGGCVPGESRACAGPAGCSGFQVCAADGKTLGDCECGDSSGQGGSGATTGQGGSGASNPTSGAGGGMPAACPMDKPARDEMCAEPNLACNYGDETCLCENPPGPGGNQWTCFTCPMPAPTEGDSCEDTSLTCDYAGETCDCNNPPGQNNTQW